MGVWNSGQVYRKLAYLYPYNYLCHFNDYDVDNDGDSSGIT